MRKFLVVSLLLCTTLVFGSKYLDELQLKEQSSVSTPETGYGQFYPKTDGKPYFKDDAGTEYDLLLGGAGGSEIGDLSDVTTTGTGDGQILIYNTDAYKNYDISGDITLSSTGVVQLDNDSVIEKTLTGYSAGAGTITATDSILGAIQKLDGNDDAIPAETIELLGDDTHTPHGFVDGGITAVTLTYTGTPDLELSIAPSATSFSFYFQGEKFTKSATETVNWTDVEGGHYFYYDSSGVLQHTTDSGVLSASTLEVGYLYWDADNDSIIYKSYETHSAEWPYDVRKYEQLTNGVIHVSGLAMNTIGGLIDQDGSSDDHAEIIVSDGVIRDQDITYSIEDDSPQSLDPIAQLPVFYKSGADADWRVQAASNFPVINFTGGSGLLAYNEFTGGAWQQTEVGNGKYVLAHIFATNNIDYPVIAIQGEDEYLNATAAREGAIEEIGQIATADAPFEKVRPLGTFIYQTSTAYGNTPQARIISTDEGDSYIDFRTTAISASAGAQDHGNLSGLSDDDHPNYWLTTGRDTELDLYFGDSATDGTIRLTSDGTDLKTYLRSGGTYTETYYPITTEGDLIIGDATSKGDRLPVGTASQVLTSNGTTAIWADAASSPGGADTQVQYNDSGSFAGDAGFTYDWTTDELTVAGTVSVGGLDMNSNKITELATPTLATDAVNKAYADSLEGTPGGNDTEVQFNDGGSFGGDAGLTYNKTTDALGIAGALSIGGDLDANGNKITELASPSAVTDAANKEYVDKQAGINYISNGNFETDISTWNSSDGTNFVATHDTTTEIRETGSMIITKGSGDQSGDYVYTDNFTIAEADEARILVFDADYKVSDDFADDDVKISLYDVENSQLIEAADCYPPANSLTSSITCSFQTAAFGGGANEGVYNLRIYQDSTTAATYTMVMDNITLGPQKVVRGAVITDWEAFTPTGSWISGNETYTGFKRRVGGNAEYEIEVTLSGTPTATGFHITLAESIDVDRLHSNTDNISIGKGSIYDATGERYMISGLRYIDANTLRVFTDDGDGTESQVSQINPITFASGDKLHIKFTVPIAGWSSSTVLSEDAGTKEISAHVYSSGQAIATTSETTIELDTVAFDKTASHNTSTYTYSIPETGTYYISSTLHLGNANDELYTIRIKNGATTALSREHKIGAVNPQPHVAGIIEATKGDNITVTLQSTADNSYSIISDATVGFFIFKIASPQTIAASEKVYVIAEDTSGQDVISSNTLTWNTIESNTGLTYSSGTFTANRSGLLKWYINLKTGSVAASIGNIFSVQAIVAGTTYRAETDYCEDTTARRYSVSYSNGVVVEKGDTIHFVFNESLPAVTLEGSAGFNRLMITIE